MAGFAFDSGFVSPAWPSILPRSASAPAADLNGLSLKLRPDRRPEFVDRIGQQQHFDALRLEALQLRAPPEGVHLLAGNRVDCILSGLHSRHVGVERGEFVAGGGETWASSRSRSRFSKSS